MCYIDHFGAQVIDFQCPSTALSGAISHTSKERSKVYSVDASFKSMPPSKATIISAYRDLYRSGLHAVQYSKPSRYVLKKTLDDAFREGSVSEFDALRIANTKLFLDNAAKSTGQEHKVVKNLLHVRWYEREVSMGRIP